jgi:hypothetical protein
MIPQAEISYDLVMEEDMSFVEGMYRLPESDWQVFIFARKDVEQPNAKFSRWDSGITGVYVQYPRSARLDQQSVECILSETLMVDRWMVVRGPDSIAAR